MAKEKKAKKETFLKGVKSEMKEVKWATAKEVAKYSFATLFLVIFFMVFFELIILLSSYLKGLFV